MFISKNQPDNTGLQKVIDALEARLAIAQPDTDEYPKMVTQLKELHKLRESNSPKMLSPDVLLTVFGNLAGILLILKYESTSVITSKAIGFVLKLR